MNIITAPQDMSLYPGLAARSVLDIRMKLGMSRISLNHRPILNAFAPVLVIDCFSDRGKLTPSGTIFPRTQYNERSAAFPCCSICCVKN